jgi:hypothetical protein
MRTRGQQLYEYKSPPFLRVVLFDQRHFATEADVFYVPNETHIGWEFLTDTSRQSWEESAKGHYLFSAHDS